VCFACGVGWFEVLLCVVWPVVPSQLVYFAWVSKPDLKITSRDIPSRASDSDDLFELVFFKRYILILLLCSLFVFTVYWGTGVNISSSFCRHPQLWAIYTDIQRLSEIAFFSRNKRDKKDNLSHQNLNITSSSNAIVKYCFTQSTIYFSSRRFV